MKTIVHEDTGQYLINNAASGGGWRGYDRNNVSELKLKIGTGKKLSTLDMGTISFLNIAEKLEVLELALSCRDFDAAEKIISVKEENTKKQNLSNLSTMFPKIINEEWIIRCLGRYLKKDFGLPVDKKIGIDIDRQIKIINHYLKDNSKILDIKIYNIFNFFIDEDIPETTQTSNLVKVFLDNGLGIAITQILALNAAVEALIFNLMISEKYLIMKEIFARLNETDIKKIMDCGSINNFPSMGAINKTKELLKDRMNYIQASKEAKIISEALAAFNEHQITGKKI